ncbi:hypothetical protein KM176_11220 [Pseudooceanicola sp. CBS1P-1]|uniref:Uncharacterized protein n=1 Tax=Pseudooceanicola albus TaxID=2692189 RepID=A0A6L7G9M7_9RHOB|nr:MULTISPECIES: AsmA-like C-terminal region-containing protein [Pseudooceanicola]MBT9384430.1 hypothetical protein [Pseudooceanicola endophyticus]MXN20669.1 hypothetical protein [Pseudooceanicola albus]
MPRRRHGLGRTCLMSALRLCLFLVFLAVLGGAGAFLTRDRSFEAPPWLRDRIEARLDAQLPDLSIGFDRLTLTFSHSWHPRLSLGGVHLAAADGKMQLSVDRLGARFSRRPLLSGRVEPSQVVVSGVRIRLRRLADGSFDLLSQRPGDTPSPQAAGREANAAMAEFKALLQSHGLDRLRDVVTTDLTVTYDDLRAGRHWTVDGGRLEMERRGRNLTFAGNFALLGAHSYATTVQTSYVTTLDNPAAQFQLTIEDAPSRDLATQSPALAWLGLLDAPLSGALRMSLDSQGGLGPLHATLRSGAGELRPSDSASPIPFSAASAYFDYDPQAGQLTFSDLSVDSPALRATAEGKAQLSDLGRGPLAMVGQLRLTALEANPSALFPQKLKLDGAELDMKLELDPFRLTLGSLTLRDGAQNLHLQGQLRTDAGGWNLSLAGGASDMSADTLLTYWPASMAEKTRDWVSQNVSAADLNDLQFALRAHEGAAPDVYLSFGFAGMTARLLQNLPPAVHASGAATLMDNRFTIRASAGEVHMPDGGALDVAGTVFSVPDIHQKPATAKLDLHVNGAVPDLLAALDSDPWNFLSKAGRSPDLAQGNIRARARISWPMEKPVDPEALKVAFAADVSDVQSDDLVANRHLSAPLLRLEGDKTGMRLSGQGDVDGVPFDGRFHMGFGAAAETDPATLQARLTLSPQAAQTFGLALPDNALSGQTQADLKVTLPKGAAPEFTLTSDLAGLGLRLDSLGWRLPEASTGTLALSGTLSTPAEIRSLTLKAPGLDAEGAISLAADGGLKLARFDRIRAGDWMDAKVDLVGRGKGVPPGVAVKGGWVDVSKLPEKQGGGDNGPVSVALDEVRISPTLKLTGFRGEFADNGGLGGPFSGKLNGGPVITGQMTTVAKGTRVALQSQDAGGVLAAAGIFRKAKGGTLGLTLEPLGPKGSYDGRAQVRDISVMDAPVLADLLSAVSVVGLFEQMAGQGLHFGEVDADFRLTPDLLTLRSASATGASMGISLDGTFGMDSKVLDMQGVFSPLYLINGVGSVLTRKGEGLMGVTFTLGGTSDNPKLKVNPLSLLMPGFLREIFRKPAPSTAPAPGTAPASGAQEQATPDTRKGVEE